MNFEVDKRILATCFDLGDWQLSRIFLKNNQHFPWVILVPKVAGVTAIDALPKASRYQLIEEISQASHLIRSYFNIEKINVGALGNVVSQLHVHVIARDDRDLFWPQGVWQAALPESPYPVGQVSVMLKALKKMIKTCEKTAFSEAS